MTLQPHYCHLCCEMTVPGGMFIVNAYAHYDFTNPTLNEIHLMPVGFDTFTDKVERIFFFYHDTGEYRNTTYADEVPLEVRARADEIRLELERYVTEHVTKVTSRG